MPDNTQDTQNTHSPIPHHPLCGKEIIPAEQPRLTALQAAYSQGVEDAMCAIRAESQGGGYWAATYINAIARRCSPFRYTGLPRDADDATREQIVQAITDIQEARESHAQWANHLRNEKHALCEGCDQFAAHIGDAEYHDQWITKYDNVIAVLARVPFATTPSSTQARAAAEEIASLSYARHRDEKIAQFAAIIERYCFPVTASTTAPTTEEGAG